MIKSMTGYGKGAVSYDEGECVVEIRSVNHRFLTVGVQCQRLLLSLENRARKIIQEEFSRGHFEVSVKFFRNEGVPTSLRLNVALAERYVALLRDLRSSLALEGAVTLDLVARMRDIISFEEERVDADEVWRKVEPALREAVAALAQVRAAEGASLLPDLKMRLGSIGSDVAAIEEKAACLPEQCRERLRKRVQELAAGLPVEERRLEQEVALYAERADVSEEITRLRSHLGSALELLDLDEPVGRKFDFYIQEMHREINTLGAKAVSPEISERVVAVKSELEKLRQQVQNVE